MVRARRRAVAPAPGAAEGAHFSYGACVEAHLASRCALQAARAPMRRDVRERLAEVERLYLDRLMRTRDANEGLTAFLEKREAAWEHR